MTAYKGFVSHIVYRNEENSYTVFELTLTGSDNGNSTGSDNGNKAGSDNKNSTGSDNRNRAGSDNGNSTGSDNRNRAGSDNGNSTGSRPAGSAEQPDSSELGDVMTCVGYPVSISEGERCVVEGEYTTHPGYREQPRVRSYRMIAPENAQAMYRYLAAGSIKRIGPAMAARIIKMFGDDTLRVMEEEPEKLARVKGISLNIAREIGAQMEDKKDLRDAMIFLQKYGIGSAHASRIWQTYGMGLYEIMKTNPYRLAEDIRGIGFATADEIARRIGIRADSEYRIRSGLLYNLFMASGEGHSFLPRDILLKRTGELLRLPPDEVLLQMENLAIEGRLKIRWRGEDRSEAEVYLTGVYRREQEIARMLLDLDARLRGSSKDKAALRKMEDRISALEKEEKITLDPLQRKAVLEAASNAVLLISGGPGTGKTTTINTIIRFFKGEKLEVVLAAPTGRAARRMSEATGCPAMTIHRLLGVRSPEDSDPGEGGFPDAGREYSAGGSAGEKQGGFSYFERGKDNPIKADVVIIDEMSMVDMNLFHALLMAVPAGARLVMVGDVNQLPSVGPGCVLQDLIESGSFHTIMLRHIFRQASESDIVMNAHRILEGTSLPMDNKSRDFFFLERDQVPVIYKHTVQLIRQMLPGYVGCRPEDIQVLTPMRRGNLGVARLNEVLQSVLNPPAAGKREHEDHDTVFREGDKVMQTRNNYGIEWEIRGNFGIPVEQGTGIFNGDFGRIMEIDPGRKVMTVCFDDARMVEYQFSDLEDLDLAYAITVHKSQGSEYPAVILPLLSGPSGLFNRNLLYTAVTRARKCVVMLGSRGAVDRMIANTQRTHRYTGLRERILEMGDGKDGGFS